MEMMFDLETLDINTDAVVLSVGAVNFTIDYDDLGYPGQAIIHDRFYRVLGLESQLRRRRLVSEGTLMWWMQQDQDARDEAFSPVRRPVTEVFKDLEVFAANHGELVTAFWAAPATFDFPIWDSLAQYYGLDSPWRYNQKYDVRSVVREAGLSVNEFQPEVLPAGKPHMPVYDCEWQIALLLAAKQKLKEHRCATPF